MGIFDRKANLQWDKNLQYVSDRIQSLPDVNGAGQPLDKARIEQHSMTVMQYMREEGKRQGLTEHLQRTSEHLGRLLVCCDYRVWRDGQSEDMAPFLFLMTVEGFNLTTEMEAIGDLSTRTALGDLAGIMMGVLESTGRNSEYMTALQEYAGTQRQ